MKLSFQISVPDNRERQKPFHQQLKTLKKLGYQGVELSVRDPEEIEVKKMLTLINGLGLEVPAIGTGRAFVQDGLSLMTNDEERQLRSTLRLKNQIEFASQFGAKVIIGLIRGNIAEGTDSQKAKEELGRILNTYEAFAKNLGVELLLEPINRYEMNFIHTVKEAIDFIKEMDLQNTGILVDTFHMNIEEIQITNAIIDVGQAGLLGYVHLADSNRLSPGQGHLDFAEILSSIADAGYDGFLSAELIPVKPDFERAANQSIKYLSRVMDCKGI